jgi:hypothetical protein
MDEAEALRTLQAILDRPQFQPQPLTIWQLLWNAFLQQVQDLASWLFGPFGEALAGHLSWLELGAGVLALALLAGGGWFTARVIRGSLVAEGTRTRQGAAARRERSDQLWRAAQEQAGAGRPTEAVRLLYLSALYALEERDVVRVDESQTNREHAARVARTRPNTGSSFAAVVQRYDPLRYGGAAPVTRQAFDELRHLVDDLRAEAE